MVNDLVERIRVTLHKSNPDHQEILSWLDGYAGRVRQEVILRALQIGLPQFLGETTMPVIVKTPSTKVSSGPAVEPAKSVTPSAPTQNALPPFAPGAVIPDTVTQKPANPSQQVGQPSAVPDNPVSAAQNLPFRNEAARTALQELMEDDNQ